MKTNIRILIATICILWIGTEVRAQQSSEPAKSNTTITEVYTVDTNAQEIEANSRGRVRIMARSYGDSIVLRWAPFDAGVWLTSIKYGWSLLRTSNRDEDLYYTTDRNGDTIPFLRLNNGKPIMPLTLDEMMERYDSTDLYIGAAAQAMYGAMQYNVNDPQSQNGMDFMTVVAKQYQEQTQRQYMAYLAAECDPRAASAMGMRFVDRNVRRGYTYEYTLESLLPESLIEMNMPSVLVECVPFVRTEEEMMPEIRITQIDAHRVALRWDKNKLSGYYVERSEDGGEWIRVNTEAPIWPAEPDSGTYYAYGDSVATWMLTEVIHVDSLGLTSTYRYRVRAFDAFGELTEWRESNNFKMVDMIPPSQPLIDVILPEENRICKISWKKYGIEPDFMGYVVTFSPDLEGPWNNVSGLLPTNVHSYTDSTADVRGRGYYRIFAYDTAGNISFSAAMLNHIEDVIPPAQPQGLAAISADTLGLVYIEWRANHEADLMAYKVYFANQLDHEFIERSAGYIYGDTTFLDTVDMTSLTNVIYYYVIAVDRNHNYSQPSDTLRVRLPDIIPPGVCVLESLNQSGDSIELEWRPSVSTDVEMYYVYRRPKGAAQWENVALISPEDVLPGHNIFFGERLTPSVHPYTYCIEAIDSARNSSGLAGHALVTVSENKVVEASIKLKANYDSKKKHVELSWKTDFTDRKDFYGVVYRSDNGGAFHDIGTFRRDETTYVDHSVPASSQCTYYIQMKLQRGRHTTPSNEVLVKTK
ncbi:MAG: hypothetical protein IJV22_05440 [Bacteroidales bacterium]|nr:hypothetical protein [Bacteroidales bacterium]